MSEEKRPITAEDLYSIVYVQEPAISPDGRHVAFVKVTPDPPERSYKRNIWVYSFDSADVIQLTRGDKDTQPTWSPDGTELAFASGRGDKSQIFVLPTAGLGGEPRALTNLPNGAHSPAWSPDGRQIAFLSPMRADERANEVASDEPSAPPQDKLALKHRKERQDEDERQRWDPRPMWRIPYRFGNAYLDERYDQIYVINLSEGDDANPRRLTDIDADFSGPGWSADGEAIFASRTTRPLGDEPWRTENVFRIDVATGSETALTDGEFNVYAPLPSPDGKWIACGRSLINITDIPTRLVVMAVDGSDVRIVNQTIDREAIDWKWSPDNKLAFVVQTEGRALPCLYDPTTDESTFAHEGTYEIEQLDIGRDGVLAMTVSTPENPQELYTLRDGAFTEATRFNHDLLSQVIVQDVRQLRFQSPNGEVQGWYLLPVGYEEDKTYPLALNIHGGPHFAWGFATKTMWHEWQFHAARGYAVFYCNHHGSGGYGEAFFRRLHAAWGPVAMDDIMAGVDAFLDLGIADENRMAITGGSYGGYMTAWIIAHSDRFKSAVAQRGVYNMNSWMGTTCIPILMSNEFDAEPWENHDAFWDNSPLKYAANITTPLLIIHAENDYGVPIEQAEQLFSWVRRATDTPVRMLRYPRDGHEMSRSGEPDHRVSRLQEMIDWFDKYAKA